MVNNFLFKDRDGQTPLPPELFKGLKIKTIQTLGELDEYEENNIAMGLIWLAKQKDDPKKYGFWLKLHKKLFENIWSWAGKVRTHELENPDFCSPHEIWPKLYQLEQDLNTWISYNSFSKELIVARFHERIETIHPFANGNGRFGRIITEQICNNMQLYKPTWGEKLGHDPAERRKRYINALIMARRNLDYSFLAEFMFS
jgi:Fic-DOC domain mobile mystery protein B